MLTPFFNLSQSDTFLTLKIKAPMANLRTTELVINECEVIFTSTPYYLRLNLPGPLVDEEAESGDFDSDLGEFTFTLRKLNEGEHFADLDLLGKLLAPSPKYRIKPGIDLCEEVGSSDSESEYEFDDEWLVSQEVPENTNLTDLPKYGFADSTQGHGRELRMEFNEILDLRDVETTPVSERHRLREEDEEAHFSDDHYLADLMEPETSGIDELLNFVSPWQTADKESVVLTRDEMDYLKGLGNRDYILDSHQRRTALLSLVDILFAFAYDHRTTLGEPNVESPWTINKISATFSWLESFKTVEDVKIASVRRSLVYPLFRNWNLTNKIVEDTVHLLKLGRRQIIKCFISIHKMFNLSEPRYLLNQLYVTDYCIWLQKISDRKIAQLCELYEKIEIKKSDVGLLIDELEAAALLVQNEEVESITNRLTNVDICDDKSDSDSTTDNEDHETP